VTWPDWSGETAVIVGTGPSANAEPLDIIRGRARVIVIKSTWRLAPWADVLYGIDRGWWIANKGVPSFKGLRVSPSPTICRIYPEVREIRLKARAHLITGKTGVIGCGLKSGGGHSGFQAINLAVQFGATRVLLVGFDMTLRGGAHWSKDYRGVSKPDAGRVETWRREMDECAPQFRTLGIEVINCAMASALTAYRKQPLGEAIGRLAA
jgi:hypothetical protein